MLTVGPVSKKASQLRFEVSRSVITVQREFRAQFRKDAPCRNNITRWYRHFVETGCLCEVKSPGRPRVSDENWLLPQLNTNYDDFILQLDGAPPIFTGMYGYFSIVFFSSSGSDVL